MAAPWLVALGKWVASLLTRPAVQDAAREMAETVMDEALHRTERTQPLPYSAVQDQQRQINAATSHKVPRCTRAPEGWSCSREAGHPGPCAASESRPTPRPPPLEEPKGPGIVKAQPRVVDREGVTPRPKPPRR